MKKLLSLTIIITATVLFSTSCKKDYTCECTYTDVIGAPGTFSFEINDQKKKDATEACENYTFAGWTEINCTLK